MQDLIIIHDPSYSGWVFDQQHPTQGRRFTNGYQALTLHAEAAGLKHETIQPISVHRSQLETVHTPTYVSKVLDKHESGEWRGPRPDLSILANLFAGGTLLGLDLLRSGDAMTVAHLPGAKHHAMPDRSSGFCVFADFAMAALDIAETGLRVAILDVDAHHGDGTETITYGNPNVLTYSVHQYGIFPGTGLNDDPEKQVFNWPLIGGDGDRSLRHAVLDFTAQARLFKPHFIFVAGGADGHSRDPLSDLRYTVEGLEDAMRIVRSVFPDVPVLFGGAGGYDPDGATPLAWARMVTALAA